MGRDKSLSVNPTALSIDRDGARSGPSVITRLRCFRSSDILTPRQTVGMNVTLTMAGLLLQAGHSDKTQRRLEGTSTGTSCISMTISKKVGGIFFALAALGLCGAITLAVQLSKEDGDRLERKIDDIAKTGAAPRP